MTDYHNEHFDEGFMNLLMNLFSVAMNTMKAFAVRKDTLMITRFNSLFLIYLKSNVLPESVHSVHLSEESVHLSVHKVFSKCSFFGVF
jgi:hypothetical protein